MRAARSAAPRGLALAIGPLDTLRLLGSDKCSPGELPSRGGRAERVSSKGFGPALREAPRTWADGELASDGRFGKRLDGARLGLSAGLSKPWRLGLLGEKLRPRLPVQV